MAKQKTRHFENGIDCRWRFRLYPNEEQVAEIHKQFNGLRFIYNKILEFAVKSYETTGKNLINSFSFAKFKQDHPEMPWLSEILASAVGYEIIACKSAFNNFYRRCEKNKKKGIKEKVGFPRFKSKKRDRNSYSFQTGSDSSDKSTKGTLVFDWENNTVRLPKIGIVPAVLHRRFEGYYSSATVIEENGEYYLSVMLELPHPKPLPKTGKAVGIDMGKRENLVIPSEGEPYPNIKTLNKFSKKLARLNRKFARQQKFQVPDNELTDYQKNLTAQGKKVLRDSSRRAKTHRQIQQLYSRIKNIRSDYAHNVALDLVRKYDVIGLENLHIKGMMKNPKQKDFDATDEEKTKKRKGSAITRKANHRSTADASWYRLKQDINYKADWYGKEVREVSTWFPSSQLCHKCGHMNRFVKDASITHYVCEGCGAELDRDVNAAINIREKVLNPKYREQEIKEAKSKKRSLPIV